MGDSVTAGAVTRTANFFNLSQYRDFVGLSWSCGGDYNNASVAGTLGNILRFYNNNLKGVSTGSCGVFEAGSSKCPNDGFNAAVSGAKAKDLLSQAERIVQEIRNDSTIDFENDWKIVTLWIGGNDLCNSCNDEHITPQSFHDDVKASLDYLKESLPRTFVSLVISVDLTRSLPSQPNENIACHPSVFRQVLCPCYNVANKQNESEIHELSVSFQEKLRVLAASESYISRDDFAVVLQPFFEEFLEHLPPGESTDDFRAVDCFHFGVRGQALLAASLWNSLFEPVGNKSKDLSWDLTAKCPIAPYYIATQEPTSCATTAASVSSKATWIGGIILLALLL